MLLPRARGLHRPAAGKLLGALVVALGAACAIRDVEPTTVPGRILSVEISPSSAVLEPGQVQAFTAIVRGDGIVPQDVEWRLDDPTSDRDALTLTSAGAELRARATAPPSPASVVLRATSTADRRVFAQATVEILGPALTITPATADVVLGESVRFTVVAHPPTLPVFWSRVSGYGNIGDDGVYTAPDTALVEKAIVAVSTSPHGAVQATATVNLHLAPPILTGYSWSSVGHDVLDISGEGLAQADGSLLFKDRLGGEVVVRHGRASSQRLPSVWLPPGVADGPIRLRLEPPGFTPVESNELPFEIPPRLRVRAERVELSSGESSRLRAEVVRGDPATSVTWASSAGTVVGDVLTAPTTVSPGGLDVAACPSYGACAGHALAISSFRVEPSPALVPAGGVADLVAVRGGTSLAATYAVVSGGGTVTPEGTFSAPASLDDSGATWLLATEGETSIPVQVGMTGLTPGIVGFVVDDPSAPWSSVRVGASWGASAEAVAVGQGRAYVLAGPKSGAWYRWIDVYDLADPARPVWLGSVESGLPRHVLTFAVHGERLYGIGAYEYEWEVVEIHDLSGPLPVLVERRQNDLEPLGVPITCVDGTHLFEFGAPDFWARRLPLARSTLADPAASAQELVLVLPSDLDPSGARLGFGTVAADGRAYATYLATGSTEKLAAWDLTADPPALLGTTALPYWCLSDSLTVAGPFLTKCNLCWDVRPPVPSPVECPGTIAAFEGTTGIAVHRGDVLLIDAAVPAAAPRVRARVHGGSARGALRNGIYYSPDGGGGLSIHDLTVDGGPLATSYLPWWFSGLYHVLGSRVADDALIFAGHDIGYQGFVAGVDARGAPASWSWSVDAPITLGRSMEVAGDLLLLGTDEGLDVRRLRNPAPPDALAVVPFPAGASAIAADGTLAWVGTGGDLVAVDLAAEGGPAEVGRLSLGQPILAIGVVGPGRVAVGVSTAPGNGDIAVVDATSPSAPTLVTMAGIGTYAVALSFDGALGLATTWGAWRTIDFSDPARPASLAEMTWPADFVSGPDRVVFSGGLAWVGWSVFSPDAGEESMVYQGYDLRNPRSPRKVAEFSTAGPVVFDGARGLELGRYGLTTWDLSRPRNVVLSRHPPPL